MLQSYRQQSQYFIAECVLLILWGIMTGFELRHFLMGVMILAVITLSSILER